MQISTVSANTVSTPAVTQAAAPVAAKVMPVASSAASQGFATMDFAFSRSIGMTADVSPVKGLASLPQLGDAISAIGTAALVTGLLIAGLKKMFRYIYAPNRF